MNSFDMYTQCEEYYMTEEYNYFEDLERVLRVCCKQLLEYRNAVPYDCYREAIAETWSNCSTEMKEYLMNVHKVYNRFIFEIFLDGYKLGVES